jgi:integrase/recombinase XerD
MKRAAETAPLSATGFARAFKTHLIGALGRLKEALDLLDPVRADRGHGPRISEALALDRCDLDVENGVLRVRRGKHGKERLLPLDPTVVAQLVGYAAERDRLLGSALDAFFVNCKGARLTDCSARYNFAHACQQIGLRAFQQYCRHGRGPRIHDLRHTFAVRTMVNWYRTGKDPAREMIRLTTYPGHTDPDNTFWHLEAVPELLDLAMARASSDDREAGQ